LLLQDLPLLIAREIQVKPYQIEAVIKLLDDGNTVPFIARYRKEATGELDEEQIRTTEERLQYLRNLVKRQEEILRNIEEQGKLTPELTTAIQSCSKLQDLEDLYLPFRPKKRTRAQTARERGLEPLAMLVLAQQLQSGTPLEEAAAFINPDKDIPTAEAALTGAMDIIAETVCEQPDIRSAIRKQLWQNAELATELAVPEEQGADFLTYREYHEPVKRIPSHRVLAVNRGEKKEMLKVTLTAPHEQLISFIVRKTVTGSSIFSETLQVAIADGYKRLLFPAMEREIRSQLTENAEEQAIRVFGLNLRQLLLQAPLAGHTIMGLDPGYRTGCKMAIVSPTGTVLALSLIHI